LRANEEHHSEGEALAQCAREPHVPLADAQVARVLHVERELRADQEDQPAHVDPDERREEDRKARVDRDHVGRGRDDAREERAARRPEQARGNAADERALRRTRVFGMKA
jgi:hypothetical protein